MRIVDMISAVQARLGIAVDGKTGPQTWGAICEHLVSKNINGIKPESVFLANQAENRGAWRARA